MDHLTRDLRTALRSLRRSPGFAAVVVLTLALGIGANTAIFTLLDQVLLRRLPVRDAAALVQLDGPGAFSGRTKATARSRTRCTVDLRARHRARCGHARRPRPGQRRRCAPATRASASSAELVSGNLFEALGVTPALGRVLHAGRRRGAGRRIRSWC